MSKQTLPQKPKKVKYEVVRHFHMIQGRIPLTDYTLPLFENYLPHIIGSLGSLSKGREMFEHTDFEFHKYPCQGDGGDEEMCSACIDKPCKEKPKVIRYTSTLDAEIEPGKKGAKYRHIKGEITFKVSKTGRTCKITFTGETLKLQLWLYCDPMPPKFNKRGLPRLEVNRPMNGFMRGLLEANKAFNRKRPVLKIADQAERHIHARGHLGGFTISSLWDRSHCLHPAAYEQEAREYLKLIEKIFLIQLDSWKIEVPYDGPDVANAKLFFERINLKRINWKHLHYSPAKRQSFPGPTPDYKTGTEYVGYGPRSRNETRSKEERPNGSKLQIRLYEKPNGICRSELIITRKFLIEYGRKNDIHTLLDMLDEIPKIADEHVVFQGLQLWKMGRKYYKVRDMKKDIKHLSVRGQIFKLLEAGLTDKEIRPFLKKVKPPRILRDIDPETSRLIANIPKDDELPMEAADAYWITNFWDSVRREKRHSNPVYTRG